MQLARTTRRFGALAETLPHICDQSDVMEEGEPDFSMAFQPIVDVRTPRVAGYEALLRGLENQSASSLLGPIPDADRHNMEQACRVVAIRMAARLGLIKTGADLSINFNPNHVYKSASCPTRTIEAAREAGIPLNRIILEITEMERMRDPEHLRILMRESRAQGLRIAIDDFGAGFAGLSMLAEFQPDILKIDMMLTRKIQDRRTSRVIVRGILDICADLNIQVIAEGVEEQAQAEILRELGIRYMQGNYFCAPAFETLPEWPKRA